MDVLFVILSGLKNFVKTLDKFYLKLKGITWTWEALFMIIMIFFL